jgi:hypothetical protein
VTYWGHERYAGVVRLGVGLLVGNEKNCWEAGIIGRAGYARDTWAALLEWNGNAFFDSGLHPYSYLSVRLRKSIP